MQAQIYEHPSSWLLTNARFYTMDPIAPKISALMIEGERITALGDPSDLRHRYAPKQIVDLAGRCVIPGLVDCHLHFKSYALNRKQINLFEIGSLQEALARISAHAVGVPRGAWIRGYGWHQELWPERAFPTAGDLDRVVPDNPVALTAKSGHAWWVNSRALEIAGITADTPDPSGGQILRDTDGKPTGILLENAIDLVREHIPEATQDEVDAALRDAFSTAWELGVTGIHDCDGRSAFVAYQRLHQQGQLGLRVHKNIPVKRLNHAIGVGMRSGLGDDWLWVGHMKVFADGALGPRTAWMIESYEGKPKNLGIPMYTPGELEMLIARVTAHGFACAVHAIGDQANRSVLDSFERIGHGKRRQGTPSRVRPGSRMRNIPHRIEHVQLLHPDDLPRLARSGIVASMQPIHATQDMEMAERYWGSRAAFGYAWRSLLEHDTTLAFGSDCPFEDLSPFLGIHAAVSRRRHTDGAPGPEGWYPQQRLTVTEALYAYTMGAARAAGMADRLGSLSPGKLADLVVLDRDIGEVEPGEIPSIRPVGTMIGGQWVFRRDEIA